MWWWIRNFHRIAPQRNFLAAKVPKPSPRGLARKYSAVEWGLWGSKWVPSRRRSMYQSVSQPAKPRRENWQLGICRVHEVFGKDPPILIYHYQCIYIHLVMLQLRIFASYPDVKLNFWRISHIISTKDVRWEHGSLYKLLSCYPHWKSLWQVKATRSYPSSLNQLEERHEQLPGQAPAQKP